MPDVSADPDDSDAGVLARWLVEESGPFEAAQTIAYVETADELFSVEAGRPGVLLKVLVAAGTQVEPGTPIGLLGELDEVPPDPDLPDPDLPQVVAPAARHAAVSVAMLAADPDLDPQREPDLDPDLDPQRDPGLEPRPEPAVAHHYLRARARVDRLAALSARLERDRPDSSVPDLVGRAVIAAHRQVPQLGVARIAADQAAPAGIPVTHPGRFGVEEAAAIVPRGETAVLAVGAVRDEPVIEAGAVVPGKVVTLTLSVRAGHVDDVQASRWLAVLVALLERPEWLID